MTNRPLESSSLSRSVPSLVAVSRYVTYWAAAPYRELSRVKLSDYATTGPQESVSLLPVTLADHGCALGPT